jgi:hypothetical protein
MFLFILSVRFEFYKKFGEQEGAGIYFEFQAIESVWNNSVKFENLLGPTHQRLPRPLAHVSECCAGRRRCRLSLHQARLTYARHPVKIEGTPLTRSGSTTHRA